MSIPAQLADRLAIPAIAAPMFLVSGPDLVVETCRSGIAGTFPALNQRTTEGFSDWCEAIEQRLHNAENPAPYGVNLIVHKTNPRVAADLEVCVRRKVPIVITSLGAVRDVVQAIHSYGGLVFHDVINRRHAEKAAEAGVDGIIAVAAGAGGHAGSMSPFALLPEIRKVFDGTLILSGVMNTGRDIAAARMMGADLAYLGTRFIATKESLASEDQKQMQVDAKAGDIVYTPNISGVWANFMRQSIEAAGLDPDNLPPHEGMNMASEARAWKNIWSAGQGVVGIDDVPAAAELCHRLVMEYREAIAGLADDPFARHKPAAPHKTMKA
jgi:nitronate monooxygenase